jgi:elongation factor G
MSESTEDIMSPMNLRNIGISAHIDSGKTTLSERILYYAGRIHRIGEVKGGEVTATMDYMELERERGITITSAATSVRWNDTTINLIDTPGHVDFTVEVERSLRVLDGAILVLCAVGGVQAQSLTIDRQMRRYGVPRLAFVNKMDRTGADPHRVVKQLRDKLHCDAVLMQLPIGQEQDFVGVVDLVTQQAIYFDGDNGERLRYEPIPSDLQADVAAHRQHLLESLAMYSDELMELLLAEADVPHELIHRVTRDAVLSLQLTPVFVGSAYRNKGVQPLLDAVVRYLPSPEECQQTALVHRGRSEADSPTADVEPIRLKCDANLPTVAMAFKIVEDAFGALTFLRIYQGRLLKGESYFNQRLGRKQRISRLVRMHAADRQEIDQAAAGDIVAAVGLDCISGDTYASEYPYCTLQSMYVPDPVIKMAIQPVQRDGVDRLSKALQRFRREDPTFHVLTDEETGETIIAGMGELHLDVYVERIRREYKVAVEVGAPKVNYREAPTQAAEFNTRFKKQTGGAGQFAHIVGRFEPIPEGSAETFLFDDQVVGGRVPRQFIPAVEKGFRESILKGTVAGYPVVGLQVILTDGQYHEVDSSELAFQTVARQAFRENFARTRPVLLEPIMKLEIECPEAAQGAVVGDLTSRRGMVLATESDGALVRIEGEVPLAETFGYSTDLRSLTQGQGTFTMEFARYRTVPPSIAREVIAERKASLAGAV